MAVTNIVTFLKNGACNCIANSHKQTQWHFKSSPTRDAATWKLRLYFLYTDFLEVNKFGLVNIKQKFTSVAASWISTRCWLLQNKSQHYITVNCNITQNVNPQ